MVLKQLALAADSSHNGLCDSHASGELHYYERGLRTDQTHRSTRVLCPVLTCGGRT